MVTITTDISGHEIAACLRAEPHDLAGALLELSETDPRDMTEVRQNLGIKERLQLANWMLRMSIMLGETRHDP